MIWATCFGLVLCFVVCSAEDLPWWKTAILYQVYPRSFKDSDGDGVGDLRGIIEKVDYFHEIGVDGIWLSPIFKSPMDDMGYDISDYCDIDPIFGTLADFDTLSMKLRKLGIRLLLDFVPNHTSDQHPWFRSALNTSDPHHEDYKDFYIWREPSGWNGTTPLPPNNWISVFDGPSWQWSEERSLFYLHQFKKQQPDLNYRNPNVVGNMTDVLRFWLDRGVSGFRIDAIKFAYENNTFQDQPFIPGIPWHTYESQVHIYTEDQPETFELINYWTEYMRKRILLDGEERTLLLEVYDPTWTLVKYYGIGNNSLTMPFCFSFMSINEDSRSPLYKEWFLEWTNAIPQGAVSTWVTGNHDNGRASDKSGRDLLDAMNLFTGVLPGNKVTYYGEEIGMEATHVRPDETVDFTIYHRDAFRTPMQWDDSDNAGFSTNSSTWLPVNPNYWWLNVEAQRSAQSSHLKVFQAMAKARKDIVLQRGDVTILTPNNDTLVVVRCYNNASFVLLMNVGSETRMYTSQNLFSPYNLDFDISVVIGSVNSGFRSGTTLKQGSIMLNLRPKAAVLLKSTSPSSGSSTVLTVPHTSSFIFMLVLLFYFSTYQ